MLTIKSSHQTKFHTTTYEWASLTMMTLTVNISLYLAFYDPERLEVLIKEDGLVENLTAFLLFCTGMRAIYYFSKFRIDKSYLKMTVYMGIGLVFLFVAGEEISWGQRIFGWETTGYFKENNAQSELNIHNLRINDTNINKLIFGKIVMALIIIYCFGIPILYAKNNTFNIFANRWGIPVLSNAHLIGFTICALLVMFIPHHKKWELFEFCFSVTCMLIILFPINKKEILT